MLRGLLYRQLFFLADVALAGVCAAFVVMAVLAGMRGPVVLADASGSSDASDFASAFSSVGPRTEYDVIVSSGLFGDAAKMTSETPDPAPAPPAAETDTELPLKLTGTVTTGPKDALATAFIEVEQGARSVKTCYIGEEVIESVFLNSVLPKEVILDNRRTNALEHLRMDEESLLKMAAAVPPSARDRAAPAAPQRAANLMEFKREELAQKLMDNYEDIASKVDVRVKEDDQGNVIGLTATNLSGIGLAQELGLQDNDVLTSINNEKIESVEAVYDVIEKYRNASTFRLGLMRDGRPMYLTYRLQ